MTPTRRSRSADLEMSVAGVAITHPDRVIFPGLGITKVELAEYFERVAGLMLPHVVNRPLVLVRCPEGTAGACFFQKHWTGALPPALDTVPIRHSDGVKRYVVVRDKAGLVTLAQWGVIEIHPWGARADDPERPDRIIFDLDPDPGAPWASVCEGARVLRRTLADVGLTSWLKTSGGKGLHVVAPIARRSAWDDVRRFALLVAEHLQAARPDRFIATARKSAREGLVYIDWLRNVRGATLVAPWCPRARPRAGVSVPIAWTRLASVGHGDQFTVASVAGRLPRRDPWRELLTSKQGLR